MKEVSFRILSKIFLFPKWLRHYFRDYARLCKAARTTVRQLATPETFFVIGNSHGDIFHKNDFVTKSKMLLRPFRGDYGWMQVWFNNVPKFITFQLAGALAYKANSAKSKTFTRQKIRMIIDSGIIPKGAKVICVLGEIDCRVHIQKNAEKQNVDVSVVIADVIKNYGDFLLNIKRRGFDLWTFGTPCTQNDNNKIDPRYPRYGTEIERNKISKIFNDKLKEFCDNNGVKFRTLFPELINSDFTSIDGALHDGCHLDEKWYPEIERLFFNEVC